MIGSFGFCLIFLLKQEKLVRMEPWRQSEQQIVKMLYR